MINGAAPWIENLHLTFKNWETWYLDQQTGLSKSDSHSQDWAVKRENGSLTREYGGFELGKPAVVIGQWLVVKRFIVYIYQ